MRVQPILLFPALFATVALGLGPTHASTEVRSASLCDSLASVPLNHGVDYETRIRPLFSSNGCLGCHNDPDGFGALDLTGSQFSEVCSLLGVASQADGSLARVAPTQPRASLLWQKIACEDVPGTFGRMPPGDAHVSLEDQALIYDWIAEGARASSNGDCSQQESEIVFRAGGFESTRD